jgi:hypothetical protein
MKLKRKSIINANDVGYLLVILILSSIVFLQKCDNGSQVAPAPKVDTVVKYVEIHDTVPGKPRHIKGKRDTIWLDSLIYTPDTSYPKLLEQYKSLGNKHFAINIYKSEFKIGSYGKAVVTDTVRANHLMSSGLVYDIKIPEKTITIVKPEDPKRQVFLGFGAFGNKRSPIDGVFVGGVYKDRQDRLSGASIGYNNGQLNFGLSSFWKIKF